MRWRNVYPSTRARSLPTNYYGGVSLGESKVGPEHQIHQRHRSLLQYNLQ